MEILKILGGVREGSDQWTYQSMGPRLIEIHYKKRGKEEQKEMGQRVLTNHFTITIVFAL